MKILNKWKTTKFYTKDAKKKEIIPSALNPSTNLSYPESTSKTVEIDKNWKFEGPKKPKKKQKVIFQKMKKMPAYKENQAQQQVENYIVWHCMVLSYRLNILDRC